MTDIVDLAQREQAIATDGSFCVSAPAGSGKTELLIQRYLALLARVERPEQVLAITFTRKAAAEMRERVLDALRDALADVPCASDHQRRTRELAGAALAQDAAHDWHMLRDISRLNIKTIDSFCAGLTRQMPVLSNFGGQASAVDDSEPLYEAAVQELYALLDEGHAVAADLRALLLSFDNNWQRLQDLLVSMLARRDQWRMYTGVHETPDESERYLAAVVADIVRDALAELATDFAPYSELLLDLMRYRARNLGLTEPHAFPGTEPADLPQWRELRQMLLTKQGAVRAQVTVREGFPADKSDEAVTKKARMIEFLEEFGGFPEAVERVVALGRLPQMEAGAPSWQLVLHLSRLLPVLAATLLVVFRREGVVDHNQVAQSALQALGDQDTPTDLALRLDYAIEHILVDEFQDTSINQYELLEKLTRGWSEHNATNPDAPRTLMIVGDAMQSIYGFRNANVGLFLKARRDGFNGIVPVHLELASNFRSDAGVVNWVNDTFTAAFPAEDDISAARVRYRPAAPVRGHGEGPAVALDGFVGEDAQEREAESICARIAQCVAAGEKGIAVLARQRSHLAPITTRLKALGIDYQAQDLDSLAHSPAVADLMTLCRVLAGDEDRLAFLALLRAPWCGLRLADLHAVANFGPEAPLAPLRHVLADTALDECLSEEGRTRIRHVRAALAWAEQARDRRDLRVWVESTWLRLGGPRAVVGALALEDVASFLELLEQAQAEGIGLDIDWLQRQVDRRFMSGGDGTCAVQVMTLHKAKGLEFERVFIPRLNGQPRADDGDLMLWDERSVGNRRAFLLAANDRSDAEAPTLYNYLRAQRKEKTRLENTRLLYVGATRAIRHLHLSAAISWDERKDEPRPPPATSLLHSVWPTFRDGMQLHRAEPVTAPGREERLLTRLAAGSLPASVTPVDAAPPGSNQPERADNHRDRAVGTVVHLALEQLAQRDELPPAPTVADRARWRIALLAEGLWGDALAAALNAVCDNVDATLSGDGAGRWVLSNAHEDARSEWRLSTVDAEGEISDHIIDRTFIDRDTGVRWIVDYKTSRPREGEDWDAFAQHESELYREQLTLYRDVLQRYGARRIRCALFFTSAGVLHTLPELTLGEA